MGIIPKMFSQYTTYGTDLFEAFVEEKMTLIYTYSNFKNNI